MGLAALALRTWIKEFIGNNFKKERMNVDATHKQQLEQTKSAMQAALEERRLVLERSNQTALTELRSKLEFDLTQKRLDLEKDNAMQLEKFSSTLANQHAASQIDLQQKHQERLEELKTQFTVAVEEKKQELGHFTERMRYVIEVRALAYPKAVEMVTRVRNTTFELTGSRPVNTSLTSKLDGFIGELRELLTQHQIIFQRDQLEASMETFIADADQISQKLLHIRVFEDRNDGSVVETVRSEVGVLWKKLNDGHGPLTRMLANLYAPNLPESPK